jgi:hypothetical protein
MLQFASGMFSNQTYSLQTNNFFQAYPLPPNTLHYVRAYATNALGTRYGAELTFTTTQSAPVISTNTVVNITDNSVSTGGTITRDGGSAVTRRGVVYSTVNVDDGPVLNGANTAFVDASTGGNGSFVVSLTGLNLSTTYFIRAYAENELGISYGLVTSFTTLASAPSTNTGISVLLTSALTTTSNGVKFYSGVPTLDPQTNANIGTGAFRYVFTPNTPTVKIYVTSAFVGGRYNNEEAVSSIHKEGTTTSLITLSALTSINANPLSFAGVGNNTAGGYLPTLVNYNKYLLNTTVPNITNGSNLQSANAAVITLNNLDVGAIYVLVCATGFNDTAQDICFAIVNSNDVNIPVSFTNFNIDRAAFHASNDIGARGGGAPVVQTPVAGIVSVLPAVTTNNLQNVRIYTATFGATVQNIGSDMDPTTVTSGIVYGTSSTNLVKDAVGRTTVVLGTGSGSKTYDATDLLANTTYYVRAWVSSGFGISYGAVIPFTTLMAYDVQSVSISNIQATQLDFTLNRVSSTGQLGYLYSTSHTNPVLTSSDTTTVLVNGSVGQNTFTLTGLLEDTVYYVRPFINTTANDAVNIGYGQTISMRTKVSNTENIAPDTYTNGTSIDFATVSNIYYKHSFTTGATDTGVVMQIYLRKLKPTTNNFIMHIVDGNGVSVMGPSNTVVQGNAQSTLINSGNNIVLSSPNTNVTATVTLSGLQSNTTYYIVNNVIDPMVGAEIQVGIAGNSDLITNLPITYVTASQSLSNIYTQLPYPITYGLADGITIDANKLTTSSVNVNGDVRQFRTTPNPSVQNSVSFNLSSDNALTESLNTIQYTYAYLSSATPVYVTYGGVEYGLDATVFGTGVFVPENTTYIYKTVVRDAQANPNGVVPAVVNVTSEHQGEGMYLVTIGTLSTSEVALSFTKISAFRLIGSVFGVNGWSMDQYSLEKSQNNNYQFTVANVPFAAGEFKIRTDSVWPQANSGVFDALDLELDSSSGLSGVADSNGFGTNLVFNGVPSNYNVTLVMTDIHRIKLMLVPSSGIAATRFVSSSASLTVGNVSYNKAALTVSYTGSYSISGLLVSASPNIQLNGAGVTYVFTQSNTNLSGFTYNFDTTEVTTYYARYYVVDVNNNVIYSNEVSFTTPVKPLLTFNSVTNSVNGDVIIEYTYNGQSSLEFRVKNQDNNSSWSTAAESSDKIITPQVGVLITTAIPNYFVSEGSYIRVVDAENGEFVSVGYQIPSNYNSTIGITGVTANGDELSVEYNVNSVFTGPNNVSAQSMYVQYSIGSGSWNDYTLINSMLDVTSTANTVVGYNNNLPSGTNVSFRFKISDTSGGFILSNVFMYEVTYTPVVQGRTILEIPDRTAVTSNIYIDPQTTVILEGSGLTDSNRRLYLPFRNLADNTYYMIYLATPTTINGDDNAIITYEDIPNSNTVSARFTSLNNNVFDITYDSQNNKFTRTQEIDGVEQTVEVRMLPLALPIIAKISGASYSSEYTELTIYYYSSQAINVTFERQRYTGSEYVFDVISTTQLQVGTYNGIYLTVPESVLDLSSTVDQIVMRLSDASLAILSSRTIQ